MGEAPAAGNATSSREVSTLLFTSGRVSEKAPFNLFFLCQGIILLSSFAQGIAQEENPEGKRREKIPGVPNMTSFSMLYLAVSGGGRGGGGKREIMGLVIVSPVCRAVSCGRVRDWAGPRFFGCSFSPPNTSFLSLSTAGIRKISYPS